MRFGTVKTRDHCESDTLDRIENRIGPTGTEPGPKRCGQQSASGEFGRIAGLGCCLPAEDSARVERPPSARPLGLRADGIEATDLVLASAPCPRQGGPAWGWAGGGARGGGAPAKTVRTPVRREHLIAGILRQTTRVVSEEFARPGVTAARLSALAPLIIPWSCVRTTPDLVFPFSPARQPRDPLPCPAPSRPPSSPR